MLLERLTRGLGCLYYCVKAGGVFNGNFAQHLAVKLNICFFAAADELAVSYPPLPAGSTEPDNPKAAEVSFFASSVDSRIDLGAAESFLCRPIATPCSTVIALYSSQDSFLRLVPCGTFFDSGHISFPFWFSFLWLAGGPPRRDGWPRSKPAVGTTLD